MDNTVFMAVISISFCVLCAGAVVYSYIQSKRVIERAFRACDAEINRLESKNARLEKINQNLQLKLQGEYARKNPPQTEFIEYRDKVSKGERKASDKITYEF